MKSILLRTTLSVAVLSAYATHSTAQSATAARPEVPRLETVTVTGNPLGATELVAPASRLNRDALLLRGQSTLGETLATTPGVSSTYFGPNASRPIIRGQDGDRIRILSNGGATVDASGLSYDHAVAADVLSVDRIEVLRGPAALLYGGSAVGGVVNLIDGRIARDPLFDAQGGTTGVVNAGFGTGDRGKNGAFLLQRGTDRFTLHLDGFARNSEDVAVPTELACSKPGSPSSARKICNSAATSKGASLGGSLLFDQGYLGASLTGYDNHYGTVAEDEVTIDMRSQRLAFEGEVRGLQAKTGGLFQAIKAQLSSTDYEHTEFEGSTPGTDFKNKGTDFRLEARHAPWGSLEGVWGFQAEKTRFSADGLEAFAPYSRSQNTALFAYEELKLGWGKLTAGARVEKARVQSLGNPLLGKFLPQQRTFSLGSFALGGLWSVAPRWQLTSNISATQRAPKDYELYADGPHIATASYEVGDPNLSKENSTNVDLGLRWVQGGAQGANRFAVSAYINRFKNYSYLDGSSGNQRGLDGELNPIDADADGVADGSGEEIVPEYRYRQVRARFAGLEASGNIRLLQAKQTVDLQLRADWVRAQNLTSGQPLPRISPLRTGATLVHGHGAWGARLGFDHYAAQRRVPAGELPTGGYTLWNAAINYTTQLDSPTQGSMLWFARVDNLTNELAYSATSILTQTASGKSPLPGRSVKIGLQASF